MRAARFLRDAAIAAAHELGVLVERPANPTHRMRALLAVIDALGVTPETPRPSVPAEGWGRLAEVIRTDTPLPIDPTHEHGYQRHLLAASAPAARELVARLPAWLGRTPRSLIDLGGGAGAYTAAFLDAYPEATATLVDVPAVAELARAELARFGDRIRIIAGDAREVIARDMAASKSIARDGIAHDDVALLANVLHLHGPEACAELCTAAARAGELVVVKDLDPATLQGKLFALGMTVYTEAGAVYSAAEIGAWLTDPLEHRLEATPEGLVVTGRRARPELVAAPPAFRRVLERALAAADMPELVEHYTVTMPARRREQLARLQAPVPAKLRTAIARLDAVLAEAGVPPVPDDAPTLAALYERTYYGELMPMLYGDREDLVAPMIHELCHLGRGRTPPRTPIDPPHLDECVGGLARRVRVSRHPRRHLRRAVARAGRPGDRAHVRRAGRRYARTRASSRCRRGSRARPSSSAGDDWRRRRSCTCSPTRWTRRRGSRSHGRAGCPRMRPSIDRSSRTRCARCASSTRSTDGAFTVRVAPPDAPIVVEHGWMTTAPRGIDRILPRYWVPLAGRHELRLGSLDELPAAADTLVGWRASSWSIRPAGAGADAAAVVLPSRGGAARRRATRSRCSTASAPFAPRDHAEIARAIAAFGPTSSACTSRRCTCSRPTRWRARSPGCRWSPAGRTRRSSRTSCSRTAFAG